MTACPWVHGPAVRQNKVVACSWLPVPVWSLCAAVLQAAAVIHMLERRAGEDNFKRLLQRLLAVSRNAASLPGKGGCSPAHTGPKIVLAPKAAASDKQEQQEASNRP